VRAVKVHKKRAHYKIDGCMAEMTEVVSDGKKHAPSHSSQKIPLA